MSYEELAKKQDGGGEALGITPERKKAIHDACIELDALNDEYMRKKEAELDALMGRFKIEELHGIEPEAYKDTTPWKELSKLTPDELIELENKVRKIRDDVHKPHRLYHNIDVVELLEREKEAYKQDPDTPPITFSLPLPYLADAFARKLDNYIKLLDIFGGWDMFDKD